MLPLPVCIFCTRARKKTVIKKEKEKVGEARQEGGRVVTVGVGCRAGRQKDRITTRTDRFTTLETVVCCTITTGCVPYKVLPNR